MSTAASFTADADLSLLKPIRDHIVRVAISLGADEETIGDFELVASELATNVIEYTSFLSVTVSFTCENDQWILDVSGADGMGEPGELQPNLPAHTSLDGRGLFITYALMDVVELVDIDEQRCIRCRRAVS